MEHKYDPRYISRDQKCISAAKRTGLPRTRQGTKLRDILLSDKPDVSSAESSFSHELTGYSEDPVPGCLGTVAPKEDELVRYMSNLPSYLARGDGLSDKALSFGVLDWKRLEKWQDRQKHISQKNNGCSPSSSSTTVFSTDGSSTHSSRGRSCSPSRRGKQCPSVRSPSPKEQGIQNDEHFSEAKRCEKKKGKTKVVNSDPESESEAGDRYGNRCSGVATSASVGNCQRQLPTKAVDRRSISAKHDPEKPLSCQTDNRQHCEPTRSSSHARASQRSSFHVRTATSPSRSTEEKPRNPSPIRRLSFTVGKMVKNGGGRDISPLCRPSSKDCTPKPRPDSTTTDQSDNSRSRSSPLRRLLEPILRSRAPHTSEPSKRSQSPAVRTAKSRGCDQPGSGSNRGSSPLQALLQVSFKNGFPLFTFATDNESNILAATVRRSYVLGKDCHNWTYTFFTVHEVKRKSGIWLNHGGKTDTPGYVPNVVAQMKVSDSRDGAASDCMTREFDLFAVDVGNGDENATDFHPTNELAAIIVKLPRTSSVDDLKDGQSDYYWLDMTQRTNLNRAVGNPGSSVTVVLPGGVHTVPSTGEISTLAQRWRSGGSCDCGGWDLGCQLRIFTNRRTRHENEACYQDKFQLFSQGGQGDELMLSLTPYMERIHSVEFSPSLSILQAFAICISFIDRQRPPESSDSRTATDKTNSEIGVFEVPLPIKTSNHHHVGAPARYVSYPPDSPVGRV